MRKLMSVFSVLMLSGCLPAGEDMPRFDLSNWWDQHTPGEHRHDDVTPRPLSEAPATTGLRPETTAEEREWWKSFHDKTLDNLVDRALKHSPNLKMARARILEARGDRQSERSAFFPQISGDASAQRVKTGIGSLVSGFGGGGGAGGAGGGGAPLVPPLTKPFNIYDASFDASWEIDLWGQTRNKVNAADAIIEARKDDWRGARLTLIAEVARGYIEWVAYQQQAELVKETAAAQQKTARIAQDKFQAGTGSRYQFSQADTLYKSTLAKLSPIIQQREAAGFELSVLLGEEAGPLNKELAKKTQLPCPVSIPALKAPADVIAARPDTDAAWQQYVAASQLHNAAEKDIFPKLTLGGMFGVEDTSLTDPTRVWSLTGGLAAPLLNFGRIQGEITEAKGKENEAFQNYRQTVLQAVAEVETDLSAIAQANQHIVALEGTTSSAQSTLVMAHSRFDAGIAPFNEVLDAEQQYYSAKTDEVAARAQLLTSLVALHKALAIGEVGSPAD